MKKIIKLTTTVFYLGFFPYLPGTLTSFFALLIFLFLLEFKVFLIILTIVAGILGFALCGEAEKIFQKKDAKVIVIDEFFGMLITCLFIKNSLFILFLAFLIFRLIDIVKFWPIKRIEKLPSSLGIMLDDVIAAIYSIALVNIFTLIRRSF